MSSAASEPVAYFWSARARLDGNWREEIARFVGAISGIVLNVVDGEQTTIKLSANGQSVEFRFARRRGGGTVALTAGARLVLVSLGVAARLPLEVSDASGEALDLHDPRALLSRIPFSESAVAIEALAEEVGLLPRRVRLAALGDSARRRRHGRVFFA